MADFNTIAEDKRIADWNTIEPEKIPFDQWWKTNPNVSAWRNEFKSTYGYEPDFNNSNYDYKGAYEAGITPEPNPTDGKYHWGSIGLNGKDLKSENHPTRWKSEYMKLSGKNPDEINLSVEEAISQYPQLAKYGGGINEIPQPQPKGSQIFRDLYLRQVNEQAPQPTFDTTAPDYMKRAAKYNAIARGLSQLASTASLGMGGSVNQPTEDRKTPAYIQGHLQYLDKYRDMVDRYGLMNYNNKLKSTGMMYDDAVRRENEAKNDLRYNDTRDRQLKLDEQNALYRQETAAENKRRNDAYIESQQALSKQRLQPRSSGSSGRSTTNKDQIEIKTKYGTVPISKADYSYYRGQAMNTPELLKDTKYFVPVLNSYNEPTGDYELRKGIDEDDLVRRMIEIEHEQRSKPQGKEQERPPYPGFPGKVSEKLPEQSQFGKWTTPSMIETKQPSQTKTIDYSKLTY